MHLLDLKKAGATDAILENAEVLLIESLFLSVLLLSSLLIIWPFCLQTSLQLGSKMLKGFGVMSDDITFLSQLVLNSMELQAQDTLDKTVEQDIDVMKPLQVLKTTMLMAHYSSLVLCMFVTWDMLISMNATYMPYYTLLCLIV